MAQSTPLSNTIRVAQATDREIRRALRDAAQEAERLIRNMDPTSLRATQLDLARLQVELWAEIEEATRAGVADAFMASARWQAAFDAALMRAAGAIVPSGWRAALIASSEQGLNNYLSRRQLGMTLSRRVYRNRALQRGAVDRVINNGLLLGRTPREIAAEVRGFIDPHTPGGTSYAALRLGRTEVVNAYHNSAVNRYQSTPWIERVKWNLSGSHGKPDICNEYAAQSWGRGWPAGMYPVDEVPSKPHPQCLCYATPVSPSLDAFARAYKRGDFDAYISAQLRKVA